MQVMARITLRAPETALIVVDVQSGLAPYIFEGEKTISRISFLAEIANLLEVPIFATEQNPLKMGGTVAPLTPQLDPSRTFGKMEFGAHLCGEFMRALESSGRRKVVLVGLETHICISLTAQGLLEVGYEVAVCPDGVSARTQERHKLGMERIRDAGIVPAHTESVAYEWLESADHPRFRDALRIVKAHNG